MSKKTKSFRRRLRRAAKGKQRSTSKPRSASPQKTKTPRYVYYFGEGHADGAGKMKPLLGGKGANLAEMTRIGLPVPPGFTITTEVCTYFYEHKRTYPPQLEVQVTAALAKIEKSVDKKLGDKERPLLVSVRSGARDSMPGMMDTILNLGMNDEVVELVARKTRNDRFAWDSYRRLLQMYGDVVMGVQKRAGEDDEPFETVIEHLKDQRYGKHDFPDVRLTVADLKAMVQRFKALIKERTGKSFPQDAKEQLWGAIGAVFGSWMNDRAIVYRRKYGIPREWGTAVNVQTMVFGNMGETSATGVAFTRDPASGEKVFYGEYLINAQGEDVVAGVRTPHPIVDLAKEMPAAHKSLMKVRALLERHFKDMQDLEFTVEDNRLYILQTRNGKRTGHAAVRIAVDMVEEKLITKKEAVRRIPADSLAHLLAPIFDR
ncbi:MAG: pyruvate, phosphate dikinase, partial [Verrucomicrobia bacterium]